MTPEQTKSAIAVMQAYVDGKEIEFRNRAGGSWLSEEHPFWNWHICDYRIKPTPIEGWVNVYPSGRCCSIYPSKTAAVSSAGLNCIKTVKMREVEE